METRVSYVRGTLRPGPAPALDPTILRPRARGTRIFPRGNFQDLSARSSPCPPRRPPPLPPHRLLPRNAECRRDFFDFFFKLFGKRGKSFIQRKLRSSSRRRLRRSLAPYFLPHLPPRSRSWESKSSMGASLIRTIGSSRSAVRTSSLLRFLPYFSTSRNPTMIRAPVRRARSSSEFEKLLFSRYEVDPALLLL